MVSRHYRESRQRGFTLAESMISLGLGCVVILSLGTVLLLLSRSSSSLFGYTDMNANDRLAVEIIGRDVREAEAFTNLSATNMTLVITGQVVRIGFSASDQRLYRITSSTNQVLFRHCKDFKFSFYQKNPAATQFPSHIPATSVCDVVQVSWTSEVPSTGPRVSSSHVARFLNRRP